MSPAAGGRRADALVLGAFALALVAFLAVSWARWPMLTGDSARELYVPFQIRHGAMLYRDFYYLYGPVAPYVQVGLLGLFGERLEVLYVGSALVLATTMATLYALSRQVLGVGASAAVLWIFFSHFALGQDIWGYMWPYAFAATYGVLFGLGMLLALARHARGGGRGWLVLAGALLGLSLVTKLEYGFAAAGLAVVYGGLRALARPGARNWLGDALALALPAVAGAGAIALAVLTHVSWPVVKASVWPVALMKAWNSQDTWHGTPRSWIWNLEWLGLVLAVMGLALLAPRVLAKLRAGQPEGLLGLVATLAVGASVAWRGGFFLDTAPHYWMGPGFLVLFGVIGATGWRLVQRLRAGEAPAAAEAIWFMLATYGCLVATRTLMLGYNDYTRYQAPVALLAWVALATRWLPAAFERAGRPVLARPAAMGALVGVIGVLGLVQAGRELAGYLGPHVAVTGPVGTVMARADQGGPFLAALAHVRAHTQPGDAIVAAPVEDTFYLFSGLDNVLKEDQLFWGYLTTPAEQQAAIRRLEARRVRYVLVSSYEEARHAFGVDYMPLLGNWVKQRCRPVAAYGTRAYRVQVYATPYAPDYGWASHLAGV